MTEQEAERIARAEEITTDDVFSVAEMLGEKLTPMELLATYAVFFQDLTFVRAEALEVAIERRYPGFLGQEV